MWRRPSATSLWWLPSTSDAHARRHERKSLWLAEIDVVLPEVPVDNLLRFHHPLHPDQVVLLALPSNSLSKDRFLLDVLGGLGIGGIHGVKVVVADRFLMARPEHEVKLRVPARVAE